MPPEPLSQANQNMYIILLLIQFILIKIGQVPLWTVKKLLSLRFPTLTLPKFHRRVGRPKKKRIPKKVKLTLSFLAIIAVIYLYTTSVFNLGAQLPSPKRLTTPIQPLTTEFFDRNGTLLYRLYEGRNRTLVKLGEVPQYLIQATLSTEDKNFYSHPGVDFPSIFRAFYVNLRYGRQEGASTLTQQLIKNTLLTPEKTYSRKIKEIILALWTERLYSKDEILQMYLNEAPYGGPAWGVEAASETYFGKKIAELTLAQSAYLAGLPASPTQFSPYGPSPDLAKIRQKQVLDRMVEDKYINKDQAGRAYAEELHIREAVNNIRAPHFVMYVKDLLSQRYGPRVVSQGGLKIYTTLDLNLQEEVEKIVSGEVSKLGSLNVKNGAAMVTDAKSGQILAMVGSKDYHDPVFGSFNVAVALRQPGSSIKPVTYAAAFKAGYSPGNTILDSPVIFKDGVRNYSPVNYDGVFHGPVSIRTALASSYNIPAVKILATVGIPDMIKTARNLGITTFDNPLRFGLSLTLGGGEVKMVDMMSVYGTFATGGMRANQTAILKVTDANGSVLELSDAKTRRVLDSEVAYIINSILSDNSARTPAFGANSLLKIAGHTVAVKTGTSDSKRDNWTFGYTPELVVGVWVGNNDNSPMNPALTSGITGAAPIWNRIMSLILQEREDLAFEKPKGIKIATVDGRKDLVIEGLKTQSLVRFARKDDQFLFSDAFSSFATPSAQAKIENSAAN